MQLAQFPYQQILLVSCYIEAYQRFINNIVNVYRLLFLTQSKIIMETITPETIFKRLEGYRIKISEELELSEYYLSIFNSNSLSSKKEAILGLIDDFTIYN